MANNLTVKGAGQGILFLDTEGMEVLYTTGGYTLYQQTDGQLFEECSKQLESVTVWGLMMKSFKDEPEFYQSLPNWMPFLQKLQMTSYSVINKMIAETRGFDERQLKEWLKERNDAELEEINFFGNSIAKFSLSELSDRNVTEEDEDEEDEE